MRFFYVYKFNTTKKKNNLFEIIYEFFEESKLSFENIKVDNIHFYEFENSRLNGLKKELMQNDDLTGYKVISNYDDNKMREVSFCNIDNMPQNNIRDIIEKSSSDIFYKIVFSKVKWFESSRNQEKQDNSNITINNTYNGNFVEMYFEINNEYCDCQNYVNKMQDVMNGIRYERSTSVLFDENDEYTDADNEISKLFNNIQIGFDKEFIPQKQKDVKKVVFGNLLKKKINERGYECVGYKAGDYVTYKLDSNNNCLQLIWTYNWSLKQVYATIRYMVPYSFYGYTLHLPMLKEWIDKSNIEDYMDYVLTQADRVISLCTDEITKRFPKTPEWFKYF